jgi:serine-type D-Ala-D-Ala carboxypeptidase (penicillin-binding protein 5/6)
MSVMRIGGIRVVVGGAVIALLSGFGAPALAATGPPAVAARVAYVADSAGTVHFGKRQTRKVPVASLVKVMTAYVVLREGRLEELVTVTKADVRHAVVNGATSAALRKGERLTVRDLLYALMLPSGADAASALARTYGPGEAGFTAKMNAEALRLGLTSTRYANADGLPAPRGAGYSTAVDQVRLAQAALLDPTFATIVARKVHKVPRNATHRAHTWRNSNELLSTSPGVIGVKTGYTAAAGYCLLFAARRGDRIVVGVLLGDQARRRFVTAGKLLDHAGERIAAT